LLPPLFGASCSLARFRSIQLSIQFSVPSGLFSMSTGKIPESMKAIKVPTPKNAVVETVPLPQLRPGFLLIRTSHVALNPTDWKHIVNGLAEAGCSIGCDYSGTVVAIASSGVDTSKWHVGDKAAGFVHGGNSKYKQDGTFAEYVVARADIQMKVETLGMDEASTLGVGISTVGQGLYQSLQLPWPGEEKSEWKGKPILIYGGSTATGALAIQFAKL
jgi:NADPH:quinone reductase-like Zn-dependent oxidoreductase